MNLELFQLIFQDACFGTGGSTNGAIDRQTDPQANEPVWRDGMCGNQPSYHDKQNGVVL